MRIKGAIVSLLLLAGQAWAIDRTEYFIRVAGDDTNCNGLANVDDSAGVRPACAKASGWGAVVQASADFAGSTSKVATFTFAAGNYAPANNIMLTSSTSVYGTGQGLATHGTAEWPWIIQGAGRTATVLTHQAGTTYTTYNGLISSNRQYTIIKDLKIVGGSNTKDNIYLSNAYNSTVQDTDHVYYTHAIWAKGAATTGGPKILRNRVWGQNDDGGSSAIKVENVGTDGGIVAYNALYLPGATGNCHFGIEVWDAKGVTVANNSLYGTAQIGIGIAGTTGKGGSATVYNNIVSESVNYNVIIDGFSTTGNTIDNNLWYKSSGNSWYSGGTFNAVTCMSGGTEYDFAGWQGLGYDTHAPTPADPLFVATTDLRLKPTSPAVNTGKDLCGTLTNPVTDAAGRSVCVGNAYVGKGAAPEIGAYEYWPEGRDTYPGGPVHHGLPTVIHLWEPKLIDLR